MTKHELEWQQLLPDTQQYEPLFALSDEQSPHSFLDMQPRLADTLDRFCRITHQPSFLLVKGKENQRYLSLIAEAVSERLPPLEDVTGVSYRFDSKTNKMLMTPAIHANDNFAAKTVCAFDEWLSWDQLFGCVRERGETITVEPGLIHQANGGVLVLPLRTLLVQPAYWFQLRKTLLSKTFHWCSPEESKSLPVAMPPMPLDIRVILLGDRFSLAEFGELEPDLDTLSMYTEIEDNIAITDDTALSSWVGYVNSMCNDLNLPTLTPKAWPVLFHAGSREVDDQMRLPLCPLWLESLLVEAAIESDDEPITDEHLSDAIHARKDRANYLPERAMDDIHRGQVFIDTEGAQIGQVNGLSVLEYPGHPFAFGEPSRISCVVHLGDGDIADVERKVELGGNIHAKGMLIMQAYLSSELALEQQLPFSASLVFEQSYGEVDGDSASLAELCALVSSLSLKPVSQSIAITGAVDQFGRVQAVGGINEKIEGFFAVCEKRGLTGEQGIILPESNLRHLCLSDEVVEAVKEGAFHLYAVEHASEALSLLTGVPFDTEDEEKESLLNLIQLRIDQVNLPPLRPLPFFLRWLNWFNHS
ncbi:MAG: AAA family ATPase [Plesiomonas sp.]|uniref:AAA family ATPase n=1 Tax=Plesiomonas sp. TaxID=2486279 RepID=UPI003EE70B6B